MQETKQKHNRERAHAEQQISISWKYNASEYFEEARDRQLAFHLSHAALSVSKMHLSAYVFPV